MKGFDDFSSEIFDDSSKGVGNESRKKKRSREKDDDDDVRAHG